MTIREGMYAYFLAYPIALIVYFDGAISLGREDFFCHPFFLFIPVGFSVT